MADPQAFALDPALYGLPSREQLRELRIWDLHYHGLMRNAETHERMKQYVDRLGIERVLAIDIGGTASEPLRTDDSFNKIQRRLLEQQKSWLAGLISVDPGDPDGSQEKMEKWIKNGPCVGIKYYGPNPDGIPCSHPNNDPIIEFARELEALVYIHTWLKVGGEPRHVGGGNIDGESTPMDVVELAKRFPDYPLICGHSGGDWELGTRAVQPAPNVYFETSGHDSHSGEIDHAVRHLGVDRVIWGGHGPSRSFATEMAKVLDADLTAAQRMKIFGGNVRRLAEPIFRRQGIPMDP